MTATLWIKRYWVGSKYLQQAEGEKVVWGKEKVGESNCEHGSVEITKVQV